MLRALLKSRINGLYHEKDHHGHTIHRGWFINGDKHGMWLHQDGPYLLQEDYYYGLKHGRFVEQTDNQVTISWYHYGKLNGPFKVETPNQIPIISGYYDNGERSGTWVYFDDEGRKMYDLEY